MCDKARKRAGRRHNFNQGEAGVGQTSRSSVGSSRGEGGSAGSRAPRTTQGNCIDPNCRGLDEGSNLVKA